MRGRVPFLVLVLLGLCALCGSVRAQNEEQPGSADSEVKAESLFAEEIRLLEAASDKEARRAAIAAVLKKSTELETAPAPLNSILNNKKPEETFTELLVYIRDNDEARRDAFITPLILIANDPGENANVAVTGLQGYGKRAIKPVCNMLGSEAATERLAAANVAGARPGGTAGVVKIVPHLIDALDGGGPDMNGVVIKSLKTMTLLDFDKPDQWREWIKAKSERDLLIEIADREAAARRKAEVDKNTAERELLKVLLKRMREEERGDAPALIARLNESSYLAVRMEAAMLLRELLPGLEPEEARPGVEAFGGVLTNPGAPDDLRKECARGLAGSGKPAMSFPYIDETLESNGISADLKLELVKGLNSPIAGARLASMLKREVDVVESRSGAVLDTLIAQVRSVVEVEDRSESKGAILDEFSRLLTLVSGKISQTDLEAPARKRYIDLAVRACDTLVHIARLRQVDISACLDALVTLTMTENGAASAALTALRQALNVPAARATLLEQLTTAPIADDLALLYQRLIGGNEESRAMLINLLGLYENIGAAPEPVARLRTRLLERAQSSESALPASPDMRKTIRGALRALLASLTTSEDEHAELITELLRTEYGANDALGYLQVLPAPRTGVITLALQPVVTEKPVTVGALVKNLNESLTREERESRELRQFESGLMDAVRSEIKSLIQTALADGLDEDARQTLTKAATGPLRNEFVPAATEQLRANPEKSDARDAISEIAMSCLRTAHPGKYDDVELKGLEKDAFVKRINALDAKLRDDGYAIP